jgi:chitodextrinase
VLLDLPAHRLAVLGRWPAKSKRPSLATRWTLAFLMLLGGPAFAGEVIYGYDELGRLKTVTYPDGSQRVYTLDPAGNRTLVEASANIPPSQPTGLSATVISSTQINLSWTASIPAAGTVLAGYKVFRGGVEIATSPTTSYSNTALASSTPYSYTVAAYNSLGGLSIASAPASATTLADTTSPAVPSGLSAATISTSQINLSWSASTDSGGSGLAGYKIYRGGVQIDTTAATTYVNAGLTPNTPFNFRVAAYDNAGNTSAQTAQVSATTLPDTTAPTVPTGLSAIAISSSQVNLAWTASSDAIGVAGYRVYRNGSLLGPAATTSYSDTTTSGSTPYSYTVVAEDGAGNSSEPSSAAAVTTPDTIAPQAPPGLAATILYPSTVSLTWNAASDTGGSGLSNYYVYRDGVLLVIVAGTSYNDSTATAVTYSYTVKARDNANNFSAASAVSIAKDTVAPSAPTLTATVITPTQVNLSWTASTDTGGSGLSHYAIYRSSAYVTTTGATSYSDTSTVKDVWYTYAVYAYDVAGNSQISNSPQVSTDGTAPTVPSNVTATVASASQVNLFWSASTDSGGSQLAGYNIYRNGTVVGTSPAAAFSDTTFPPNTPLAYSISAFDGRGNTSAQSSSYSVYVDTIPPTAPTGLSATAVTINSVSLVWNASTDAHGVSYYRVTRSDGPAANVNATSYTDASASPGVTYIYQVVATDGLNNSAPASITVTTPSAAVPSIPTQPTGLIRSSGTYTISWSASTGPVSYYVLQEDNTGSDFTDAANYTVSTTSKTFTVGGGELAYRVKACTAANLCSGYSNTRLVLVCNGGCP